MDELRQTIASPTWWFSAVVVAIIVNLLSAYLKSPLEKFASKLSVGFRTRTQQAKARFQREVEELSQDKDEQILVLMDAVRFRVRSNGWLVVVLICLLFYLTSVDFQVTVSLLAPPTSGKVDIQHSARYFLFFGIFSAFAAMRCSFIAIDKETLVARARRLRKYGEA